MEINIPQDILAQVGAENHADLVDKLRTGYQKGRSIEHIEQLGEAILKNAEATQKALAALSEKANQEEEVQKFEQMVKSRAADLYKSLDPNDPQRIAIRKSVEAELGRSDAAILLEGDAFVKALQAPIYEGSDDYEQKRDMRKAFDYLMLFCAAKGDLWADNIKPDSLQIKKRTLQYGHELLKKQGLPGAEYLQKAIDQALDEQTSTEGLEWVPSQILSRNLYQDVWLDLPVAGQFQRLPTQGPVLSVPIRTARSRMYAMPEATVPSDFFTNKARAHNMNTGRIDFAIKKAAVLNMISDELVDDSVIPILAEIYNDIVYASQDGIEDAVLNGSRALNDLDNAGADTYRLWANTADQGDGIRLNTGTADCRYLWNGIRKSTNSSATIASANFGRNELIDLRATMGKYGVDTNNVFFTVSPRTYLNMLKFPEVATMEKFGANATVVRGALAKIDNIDIMMSPKIREDLDNKGYYTGGSVVSGSAGVKTKTVGILTHRRAYAFADRMAMRVESDRMILSQQRAIIATLRLDFKKMFQNTENTEAFIYNI